MKVSEINQNGGIAAMVANPLTPKQDKQYKRRLSLLPNGKPKYVRCYDNGGESFDRYTVVFTGRYTHKTNGGHWYVGMSENPFHPQGFGQHGETEFQCVDRPTYGHLGKKISFDSLPEDCQKLVMQDYVDLWDIVSASKNSNS